MSIVSIWNIKNRLGGCGFLSLIYDSDLEVAVYTLTEATNNQSIIPCRVGGVQGSLFQNPGSALLHHSDFAVSGILGN